MTSEAALPPDVLLTVTMLRPDEKLIRDALVRRGLTVGIGLGPDVGDLLNGRQPAPGVVLVRNLSHADAASVTTRLEQAGIRVVNSAAAVDVCHDKGRQALLFARRGIPHPRSYHAYDQSQLDALVDELGWPVVVKPLSGSWGRGVVRLTDRDCLAAWAGGAETSDAGRRTYPVLVQEHVNKPGRDIRVLVVGAEPVVAFTRESSGDWRTNTHLGAEVRPLALGAELRGLVARVVEVLGPGFYGLDLMEDGDALTVLEVNANPDLARSVALHGDAVVGALADLVAGQLVVRSG